MIDRATLADSIRFWETGRLGYNGVLAAILLMLASVGDAWETIARNFGAIIILGAVANLLYCIAYPIDLAMQATPLREGWRRWRWIAWAAGTVFAALLALIATIGIGGLTHMGPPD
jgi:hypothetical protein